MEKHVLNEHLPKLIRELSLPNNLEDLEHL